MKKKIVLILLLGLVFLIPTQAGQIPRLLRETDETEMNRWVDSVMQRLTIPERIGQLFVVGVENNLSDRNKDLLKSFVNRETSLNSE